jgi:hypothetical protein
VIFLREFQLQLSCPAHLPQPSDAVAWSEATAFYAMMIGIADVDRLRGVLAKGLADLGLYASGGGRVRTVTGQIGPATASTYERHERLAKLITALDEELAGAEWPLADGMHHPELRAALGRYGGWLNGLTYSGPGPRQFGPRRPVTLLALNLAHAWPDLTGEQPRAWHDAMTGRPGGRFYDALRVLCQMFSIRPPSVSSTRRLLAHISMVIRK